MNPAPAVQQPPLMSPADVSALIGIPEKTLANWRSQGKGPEYMKVGRHVRYRPTAVDAWLVEQVKAGVA